jgi:ribosome-associated toxin RatA of RatAB toxin-antitoxin module
MWARFGKKTSRGGEFRTGLLMAAGVLGLVAPAAADVPPATAGMQLAAVKGELGAGQWRRLEGGWPLVDTTRDEDFAGGREHLIATCLVDAPPEAVWQVITDFEGWAVLFPGIGSVEVARLAEDRVRVHHHVKALGISVDFTTVSTLDPEAGLLAVVLDRGADNDLVEQDSRWELIPNADRTRTLVRLRLHVVSGQPIPAMVERFFIKRSVEKTVEAVVYEVGRHPAIAMADVAG